jgi:hypothetical protein
VSSDPDFIGKHMPIAKTIAAVMARGVVALGIQGLCCAAQADSGPTIWQTWLASLQSQGYGVTQGSAYEFTPAYCQQVIYPVFKTCFSSDPGDPYLQPLVPMGNGYIDPYYHNTSTLPDGTVVGQDYRLDTTEALLVILTLPPQAAYFSYESYLFSRPTSFYPNGYEKLSPDPTRASLFATFNNSINNVQVFRQSGLSFGQGTVAFITTANSTLTASLVDSFSAVGGNPSLLFTEALGSTLNPGLDQDNDDFSTVVRYSVPQSTSVGNHWRSTIATQMRVFRIDQPAGMAVTRYGTTPLSNKSFNADETSQAGDVAELSQLLQSWLATEENDSGVSVRTLAPSEKVSASGVIVSGEVGPYCIQNGTDCGADQQDSAAYWGGNVGTLAANQMFIVDGVNHSVTNNTTFMSLGAADASRGTGIASAAQTNSTAAGFTSGSLTGSAAQVLQDLGLYGQASPGLISDLPNLYVHIFTRPCDPALVYCSQPYTTTLPTSAVPLTHVINMTERAYVLPGFLNGANPKYLLDPDLIY